MEALKIAALRCHIPLTDKRAEGAESTEDEAQIWDSSRAGQLAWGEFGGGNGLIVKATRNLCRVLNSIGVCRRAAIMPGGDGEGARSDQDREQEGGGGEEGADVGGRHWMQLWARHMQHVHAICYYLRYVHGFDPGHCHLAKGISLSCRGRGEGDEEAMAEDEAMRVLQSALVLLLTADTAEARNVPAKPAAATAAQGLGGREWMRDASREGESDNVGWTGKHGARKGLDLIRHFLSSFSPSSYRSSDSSSSKVPSRKAKSMKLHHAQVLGSSQSLSSTLSH